MSTWPSHRIVDLLQIELPILLAPMAGPGTSALAIAVAEAGGLGSLACGMLSPDEVRSELASLRQRTAKPINLNFMCHPAPTIDPAREAAWRQSLLPYYRELGIDAQLPIPTANRQPFDSAYCEVVKAGKPEVVSFHFGLPNPTLLRSVKESGAKILSSATTVDEARWLEDQGCDAIIAQGFEAGGHRGMFLSDDIATQVGTMALLPQVVDAVKVPVIAAGGIGDARGIVAAFALGASAVQLGTAYLFCPEAKLPTAHRQALRTAKDDQTVLTNVFSGRPARGFKNRMVRERGPMSTETPAFPLAGGALAPLRAQSEKSGSGDFTPMWSGQAARLSRELSAFELTRRLAEETLAKLRAR